MADPYASHGVSVRGAAPRQAPPWGQAVAERGGAAIRPESGTPIEPGAIFGFVALAGTRIMPPIARLDPAGAAMLALLESGLPAAATAAGRLEAALLEAALPMYVIKQGLVGGPAGSRGAIEVDAELVAAVLEAEREGLVGWRADPDFGHQVAERVPGLTGDRLDCLCPRLLYATHDRVYEHARTVAEVKRERRDRLRELLGPDAPAELLAATGWPIEPTGGTWRD